MDKDTRWIIKLGLGLVALSAALYGVHYAIFHDSHHIFLYLVGDIAFVPIEVLLVTLVLHRMLEARAKQVLMQKLNMVIGAFFSEIGRPLIELLVPFDTDPSELRQHVMIAPGWKSQQFAGARAAVRAGNHHMDARQGDAAGVRDFLDSRRDFILSLLANPNLLEHESFTELLWSVLHLQEELAARPSFDDLAEADSRHLSGDMQRAYANVLVEWVSYLEHLSTAYPYLYSLAVRQNPLNPEASVTVTQ